MSNFVPATQQGGTPQGRREFTSEDLILTPAAVEANYRAINTRLPKATDKTVIRVLPSFDENGVMMVPLNPDYQQGASIGTMIGTWAASYEVADGLGLPHSMTMITSVSGDNAGNAVNERHSPASKVVYNCTWKIKEMQTRLEMGESMESLRRSGQPIHWLDYTKGKWAFSNLRDPYPRWFVQCLCSTWAGHAFRDKVTNQLQAKARFVLMFSNKLFKTLTGQIAQKYDANEKLTLSNSMFGDFLSPDQGHPLMITKTVTESKTQGGKTREDVTYNVQMDTRAPLPVPEAKCLQLWQPWNKLLRIPTVEESIEQLIKCLGPDMVDFGLKGSAAYPCAYVDYIPDSISGASRDIPETVNTKVLKERGLGNAGGAPSPQNTPGYPTGDNAEPSTIVIPDDDVDQIPFDPPAGATNEKPTPPPFPMDDEEGEPPQATTDASVAVDFNDDNLSGGNFSDNLEQLAKRENE